MYFTNRYTQVDLQATEKRLSRNLGLIVSCCKCVCSNNCFLNYFILVPNVLTDRTKVNIIFDVIVYYP